MPPCSMPSSSRRRGPLLELGAVGAAEGDVVETDAVLAEALGGAGVLVLVQAEQRAVAEQVHGVVHVGVGVLVEHGLGVEAAPRTTGRSRTGRGRSARRG